MVAVFEKSKSLFKTFLDLVLPPVCYVCGNPCSGRYGLCEDCLAKINYCECKENFKENGWSCCYYKDALKECIHLFKYKGYVGLADIFGDIMASFVKKNGIGKETDLIVPVPVHPAKRRERSYNHAEVLAASLSRAAGIPVDARSLKKIRWTTSQSELDRKKRLDNVKDTFLVVNRSVFSEKRVLLVDDVYTTGATINECTKALLEAGASKICFLTLAKGV